MAYLISNIPYEKVWIRKDFTNNHGDYEGEFLHGLIIAVTTMPDRCLSFQVVKQMGQTNPIKLGERCGLECQLQV